MKKKILISSLVAGMMLTSLTGCIRINVDVNAGKADSQVEESSQTEIDNQAATENADVEDISTAGGDITIVYTNDVHSYIDNVLKDSEGNVTGDGLRFSKIKAMVDDMREAGENVILVDAGDEIQGDIYGAMDQGDTVIKIMDATGYELATPGNHEFDYGVDRFIELASEATFPYVSCNFHSSKSRQILFPDSMTFDMAGKKVAFVGITTPETITSSTPAYFMDDNGEYIYAIDGTENVEDLYTSVQSAIDRVRDDADYVIALGHVGVGMKEKDKGISSEDIIANVTGLDAFIDGHSHTTMECELVKDKDGEDVPLTQTGYYLNAVGVMTISEDGEISTELVNDYDREDETVAKMEQDWIQDVEAQMGEKIGVLDTELYICNPDNDKQRLIRSQELNAGDFVADSMYWFLNDKMELDCDAVIMNGGGVRAAMDAGDISYMSAKTVEPFGNMVCLITTKGQKIIDALEMGCTAIGQWNDEWDCPAENGGFLHVAGLSYSINAAVPTSVEVDGTGMFVGVNGDYRVSDVKIYNRESGQYEPIDPDKEYTLGGINYLLRNSGSGLNMFANDELVIDYVGQDYTVLAEYIKSFDKDGEYARVNTANSPLADYEGYMIDYEDPFGAGRIDIHNISVQSNK